MQSPWVGEGHLAHYAALPVSQYMSCGAQVFGVIDIVTSVVFIVDIFLKLFVYNWNVFFCTSRDMVMNWLDTVVAAATIPGLFALTTSPVGVVVVMSLHMPSAPRSMAIALSTRRAASPASPAT